jgi:GTP-binding protein HflX
MPKPAARSTERDTETAFLVFCNTDESEDGYVEAELEGLCEAAGVAVAGFIRQRLDRPNSSTFIGKGKVDELAIGVVDSAADLVIFDAELNAVQVRNLEERVKRRVLDRTQLILDIFAQRAKTREGQLQVELAQLSYMMPRLMSLYTKFERQKGGIGMRGPGETKLESDRRMVKDRISKLSDELEVVKRHRDQERAARRKNPFPFATIVGYTSAGKSTLMNRLSGTQLLADDMPFATLDPTTRRVELPEGYSLFLTDTVGFIRNLPTHLVAAFRATLEEVSQADFILHVIDASNPDWELQHDAVVETLKTLNADEIPAVMVFNKIDLLDDPTMARRLVAEWTDSVAISAAAGIGIEDFLRLMVRKIREHLGRVVALLPYDQSGLVDECYRFGRVLEVSYRDEGIYVVAELVKGMREKLAKFAIEEP